MIDPNSKSDSTSSPNSISISRASHPLYPSHPSYRDLLQSSEERIHGIYLVIERIGYRPLARDAVLSAGHVHRVLNGKIKQPTLGTLKKIAKVLHLTLEDVIFYVECQMEYVQKKKAA